MMRKTHIVLAIALALALFGGLTFNQVHAVSAQGESPVGVVVAYMPGVSITIIDKNGLQLEFVLDPSLKIEPAEKADSLKVGSLVTVIAPASLSKEKQIAVGIVVHPETQEGSKPLLPSATPLVKNTPMPAEPLATATPKMSETTSASATPAEKAVVSQTATPVETTPSKSTTNANEDSKVVNANAFIEWLRSLFVQLLSRK
jgi:hypothetical protein